MGGGGGEAVPTRSPWVAQLAADDALRPLTDDVEADVVVVGAGIAGVATAWFLHRRGLRVVLVERDRVGRGATGHNAGQLVSYFERPLTSLVEEFGFERAMQAQADVQRGWDLLEAMVTEAGVDAPVHRTIGTMGMWSADQVITHLRGNALREQAGIRRDDIVVSEGASFLDEIPADLSPHYRVVPQSEIDGLMGRGDHRYRAVLSSTKGCANSALIAQQVLAALRRHVDGSFDYFDGTPVERVVLERSAEVHALGHVIRARHVVLCTNGYRGVDVENRAGEPIDIYELHGASGVVGYMAGFLTAVEGEPLVSATSYIRNERIGGDVPYVYSTVRPYELQGSITQLQCMGGPEEILADSSRYDATSGFPREALDEFDGEIREIAFPDRPAGGDYPFTWHGLMGYTRGQLRVVGAEPRNPALLYNLGCNGVGLLPGIFGASRVAAIVAGDVVPASIFDPC